MHMDRFGRMNKQETCAYSQSQAENSLDTIVSLKDFVYWQELH